MCCQAEQCFNHRATPICERRGGGNSEAADASEVQHQGGQKKKEKKKEKRLERLTTPSSGSGWCDDDPRDGGENRGVCVRVCVDGLVGGHSGAQTAGINT